MTAPAARRLPTELPGGGCLLFCKRLAGDMATAGGLPGRCATLSAAALCAGADDLIGPRGLRHRKAHGTMQASSPTKHRARSCPVLQDISAAKRQCTPSSAPCGASTSPCRGGFIEILPPKRLPCKGSCRRQPTEGCRTRLCQYPSGFCVPSRPCGITGPHGAVLTQNRNATPSPPGGRERPPYNAGQAGSGTGNKIWRWFFGTMQASSPAKGRCGLYRLSVLAGPSQ